MDIAALEARIQELTADSRRLDFIEREWFLVQTGYIAFGFNETWAADGESLRAAIDADMAAAEAEGE